MQEGPPGQVTREEVLACLQAFDGMTVDEQYELPGGLSGAYVGLVSAFPSESPSDRNLYIAKVGDVQRIDEEYDAQESAHSLLGEGHVPELCGKSQERHGKRALLMRLAHDSILRLETLEDMILKGPRRYVRSQLDRLINQIINWKQFQIAEPSLPVAARHPLQPPTEQASPEHASPYEMLKLALDGTRDRQEKRSESVGDRLEAELGIDQRNPLLSAGEYTLPNPVAYIAAQTLWGSHKARAHLPYRLAPSHGDLRTKNVVCLCLDEDEVDPTIIDWASFESRSFGLFDLAYLEFDLIFRSMSRATATESGLQSWFRLLRVIMHQGTPKKEVMIPAEDVYVGDRAAEITYSDLLVPFRRRIDSTCVLDTHLEWWIACVASGLNWARKQRPNLEPRRSPIDRALALLYAAFALAQTLSWLDVEWCKHGGRPTRLRLWDY